MPPGRFPPSSFPIRELSPGGVYPKHQSQPGLFLFLWTMALPGKAPHLAAHPPTTTAPAQQPSCCPFPALTRPQQPPSFPGSAGDVSSSLAGSQSFVYCSQSKPRAASSRPVYFLKTLSSWLTDIASCFHLLGLDQGRPASGQSSPPRSGPLVLQKHRGPGNPLLLTPLRVTYQADL